MGSPSAMGELLTIQPEVDNGGMRAKVRRPVAETGIALRQARPCVKLLGNVELNSETSPESLLQVVYWRSLRFEEADCVWQIAHQNQRG